MVASQSSRVSSSNGRAMSTPALLTRTSISPSAPRTARPRRDLIGTATSAAAPAAVDPLALQLLHHSAHLGPGREQMPTR